MSPTILDHNYKVNVIRSKVYIQANTQVF